MEAVQPFYDFLKTGGILAGLVLFIAGLLWSLQKGWVIPGSFYRELQARNATQEARNTVYEQHFRDITDVIKQFKEALDRMERTQAEHNKAVLEKLEKLEETRREGAQVQTDLLRDIVRLLDGGNVRRSRAGGT